MSGTVRTAMLMVGLVACSSVAAREPERDGGVGTLVAGTLIEATIDGSRSWRRNPLGETLTAIERRRAEWEQLGGDSGRS